MNLTNLILNTDSYKFSHYLQYPPETHAISSYIEARGQSFTGSVSIHDWLGVPRDSPGVGERGVEVVVGLVEQGPGSVQLVGGSERGAVPGEVVAVIVLCPVPVGEVSIGELV